MVRGQRLTIGREDGAEICIRHSTVSRQHAEVRVDDYRVRLRDLGSRNGSFVGGRRLARDEWVEVSGEQPIELGDALVVFRPTRTIATPTAWGVSAIDAVRETADQVAHGRISVLIRGETGVGKEVLAGRIHARSPRASAPFVRVNCAALPEALLEGELFGYERGAFTGAVSAKPGLLESADRGTLFLDEIGDLPAGTQAKLLRVLEAREVTRLGSVHARKIDVRFVSATNRDLAEMIREGRFRADLYYRLDGVTLEIPPLRERRGEIEGLARSFLRATCAELRAELPELADAALQVLHEHHWPGNARELKNVIECAVLVCGKGPIESRHLKIAPRTACPGPSNLSEELASLERRRVEDALASCSGNQTRAAKLLGIPRHVLVARISEYGLPRPRKR
ncbi:MAG: sigma 54-interacting transcriptional regulator [Deltaproteobacteria bacterium]|nr:sigma 54-interacting transcriptional regulator [Deltaproteobacteria bacterium]